MEMPGNRCISFREKEDTREALNKSSLDALLVKSG
jgi:hypothetical protein